MFSKSGVRKMMRERLRQLTRQEIALKSVEICKIIQQTPEWKKAEVVSIFAPIQAEPDLELLEMKGRKVCYPRVTGPELDFYFVEDRQSLAISKWGIREPIAGIHPAVTPEEIDLIFVPGLAFSSGGGRLGRGAGFYDRLFARSGWRAEKIGVGFDCQLVSELPLEAHDHQMDGVITESGGWMGLAACRTYN